MPYRIAVGGYSCRTCRDCHLYIDKHAHSEAGFMFGSEFLADALILEDPTDEELHNCLGRIPSDEKVVVISSMQGGYSLGIVPKILEFLRRGRYATTLRVNTLPEEMRKHVSATSIELLADKGTDTKPTAFVSYSWESEEHRQWVLNLATRLRGDGLNVKIDQWNVRPGDNLPEFMETCVRDNDFVLIICTPIYKQRSDSRIGGVGYEGAIMTAEAFTNANIRKFIPVLSRGSWQDAAPSWLLGKFYVDLRGESFDEQYRLLVQTMLDQLPKPPPVGA